jgi:hypothetical protein
MRWATAALLLWAAIFVFALRPASSGPATTPETTVLQSDDLVVRIPADLRKLGETILQKSTEAREAVFGKMPIPLKARVTLVWCDTEDEFYERVDARRGHLLAVARPSAMRIYLNGPAMRRVEPAEMYQTLVHEFVHLYIGRIVPDSLPVWLNEGLAMYASGDWGLDDRALLATRSLFGGLLPIEEITRGFPADAHGMQAAYRQSYSMTAFLIDMRYPKSGLDGLITELAEPGSEIHRLLRDPIWLSSFEERWREQRIRPGRIIIAFTSGGTLWILLALLLIVGYLRKRRQKKRRESRWAVEEEFGYDYDGFDD